MNIANLCSTCVYNKRECDCVPVPDQYGYCLFYVEGAYFAPVYIDKDEEKVSE